MIIFSNSVESGLEDNIKSFEDNMKAVKDNLKTEQTCGTDNNDNNDFITDKYSCDNQQYSKSDSPAPVIKCADNPSWLDTLRLDQLSWVGTLGIGGFGRVELVTAGENNNMAFALKKMKKNEVSLMLTN